MDTWGVLSADLSSSAISRDDMVDGHTRKAVMVIIKYYLLTILTNQSLAKV